MEKEDLLRTVTDSMRQDSRILTSVLTPDGIQLRTLEDQHQLINRFVLIDTTPESIRVHFETAKNLYLYAWYVYRFHMVSEHYVFSTLELALRERLNSHFTLEQWKRPPSLGKLIGMAVSNGYISNDRLQSRTARAIEMAHNRLRDEVIVQMQESGIQEMSLDFDSVHPNEDELAFDWVGHFAIQLPRLRNMHAHGSDHLYPNVLWTFEVVWELINQLYEYQEAQT